MFHTHAASEPEGWLAPEHETSPVGREGPGLSRRAPAQAGQVGDGRSAEALGELGGQRL